MIIILPLGIYAKMVSGQNILCVCGTNMGFTLHLQIHHITLAFAHSSCNVLHFSMLQNTFPLFLHIWIKSHKIHHCNNHYLVSVVHST